MERSNWKGRIRNTLRDDYLKQRNLNSIPKKIKDITLVDENAQIFSAGLYKDLIILGPTGVGKTVLAYKLMERYITDGYPCTLVTIAELLRQFDEFRHANDGTHPFTKYGKQECVVVLDDLGTGRQADREREIMYQIMDYRYMHNLPTIITSNLTLDQIESTFDGRLLSRIMGMCEVVELSGPDRRIHRDGDQMELFEV